VPELGWVQLIKIVYSFIWKWRLQPHLGVSIPCEPWAGLKSPLPREPSLIEVVPECVPMFSLLWLIHTLPNAVWERGEGLFPKALEKLVDGICAEIDCVNGDAFIGCVNRLGELEIFGKLHR